MTTTTNQTVLAYLKKHEAFAAACDKIEAAGKWNAEENGPMATYYESDIASVALMIMSADGKFTFGETDEYNIMFQTSYLAAELEQMYNEVSDVVDDYLDNECQKAIGELAAIDPELAEKYKDLVLAVCEVASTSDETVAPAESALTAKAKAALQ